MSKENGGSASGCVGIFFLGFLAYGGCSLWDAHQRDVVKQQSDALRPIDPYDQAIRDFDASHPELEDFWVGEIHHLPRWANGERRAVGTLTQTFDVYFIGNEVVSVRNSDGTYLWRDVIH